MGSKCGRGGHRMDSSGPYGRASLSLEGYRVMLGRCPLLQQSQMIIWAIGYSEWSMGLLDARLSYWLTLISTHSFSSLYPCANVSLFFACPLFSQLLQHFSSIVALIHKEIITRSLRDEQTETRAGINRQTQRPWGGRSAVQRDGVKDKEEVKERQQRRGRDRWGCRDELKERRSRKQRERGRCNYLSGVRVCVTEEEAH